MLDKNLLIISNNFPNQDNSYVADVFVKEQLKYLKDLFNEVYVISPVAYGMERLRNTIHSDYQYDNVKVFFPKYLNIPFCYSQGKSIWRLCAKKAVIDLINKEKLNIDLIHAHFTWPSGAVAVDLKEYYNIPVIITEHTSNSINRAIEKNDPHWIETWKKADIIIRVKKGDIKLIEKMGIPKENIINIPNGYSQNFSSLNISECREALGLPQDKKILLNVGNLYGEVKGHKYLIEAISHIIKTRCDFLCIIIGAGKLKKTLERQIRLLGLEDYIILAGGKSHDEIPLWMNACDLFVLPSLNEGNPTVMFEALGCGKPFVGTKVGGVPEIIISDDYGLLVEPGNSEDLAGQILVALDREWDREEILAYGKKFTWDKISKEILEIYSKLI